jgi:hypothetical protein
VWLGFSQEFIHRILGDPEIAPDALRIEPVIYPGDVYAGGDPTQNCVW